MIMRVSHHDKVLQCSSLIADAVLLHLRAAGAGVTDRAAPRPFPIDSEIWEQLENASKHVAL